MSETSKHKPRKKIVIDARESGTSTGTYIDNLIKYLYRLNPQYDVVLLAKKHRVEFLRSIAPNFAVKVTPFKEFTFGEQLGFLQQIKRQHADLVFFPAVQQPILYRGKVVTTAQDLTGVRFRNPSKNWLLFTLKQWVYIWVNKYVGKKSVELITPTQFVKDDFAKFARINARKITVTLEAADKITEPPEPLGALKNKKFIMYVGRPAAHKNLNRLVDAFALLKKENPKLHLVLVGKKDANYRQLEKYVASQGISNVVFTDWISEGQKRWLYENTAAYVFPSLSEGFGLPSLEAMMHGAPVVSSNATCLPEVNKDAALYFDPLDTNEMAAAIAKVLNDSNIRNKLIKRGTKVSGEYSWERMAKQTLEVFERVLHT